MVAMTSFLGVPTVLKFLKFQNCPEIVMKFEILLKFYSFGKNVRKMDFEEISRK